MSSRVTRFLVLGLLVVLGGLLAPHGTASAHAELLEIVPADGAVVPEAPSGVTLRFSEPISLTGGSVRVLDDAGDVVADGATVAGDTINLPLPAGMSDGTYTVAWAIISADSHRITGASVFHVGAPSASGPVAGGVGSDEELSWALRAGRRRSWPSAMRRSSSPSGWRGSRPGRGAPGRRAADLAGPRSRACHRRDHRHGRRVPLRAARVGGGLDALGDSSFVGETLRGPLGISTLVTVVGLLVLAVATGLGDRWRPFWVVGAGLVALLGFPIEGHTRTNDPVWLMITSDVVHLAAGAIWVGGSRGSSWRSAPAPDPTRLARTVRRFSAAALGTVVVLAIAGTVMAVIVLPSLSTSGARATGECCWSR